MTEVKLQDGVDYARRFILSACMNWNECRCIQAEATKANAWKKAKKSNIRIDSRSWHVEIGVPVNDGVLIEHTLEKHVLETAELKEVKDSDKDEPFLCIQMNVRKNEYITVTGERSFIELFKCGLEYHLNLDNKEKCAEIDNNEVAQKKIAEFNEMVEKIHTFLDGSNAQAPPIPPLPPNMDFAE